MITVIKSAARFHQVFILFKFCTNIAFFYLIPRFIISIKTFPYTTTFVSLRATSLQCSVADIKSLLEGCDRLSGLNVTSVGGTIVNDHNCDVLLPKQVFIEEPLFQYPLADSKKFYTLIMVDPDAPPQMEGEFYLHMLKSNIPGLALKSKESSKTSGIDYRGYKAPTPPRGTGPHRYITLLFEQADGNNFLPNVPQTRNRFMLSNWLRGKSLCGPVAGIQFRSQF